MDVDYIHNTFNFGFPPQSGYDFKLFPAVFIDIKNGFGLNFDFGGIEYQSTTQSDLIPKDHTNIFAFTFGQGIIVGISKNFGGRKK
jgi:hypothetical protein